MPTPTPTAGGKWESSHPALHGHHRQAPCPKSVHDGGVRSGRLIAAVGRPLLLLLVATPLACWQVFLAGSGTTPRAAHPLEPGAPPFEVVAAGGGPSGVVLHDVGEGEARGGRAAVDVDVDVDVDAGGRGGHGVGSKDGDGSSLSSAAAGADESSSTATATPPPSHSCNRILVGVWTTVGKRYVQERRISAGSRYHRVEEPLDCGINMVFVVGGGPPRPGQLRHETTSTAYNYTVFLNKTENMNDGKAYDWLHRAPRLFPEADFIYKVDMDTQICTSAVANITDRAIRNGQDYVGYQGDQERCGSRPHCPERRNERGDNWWYYMVGAIYGLSRRLALAVTSSAYARENVVGPEDLMVGRWVHEAAPRTEPYHIDCLKWRNGSIPTGEPCPVHHWEHNLRKMPMDDSLCDVLDRGGQMPWINMTALPNNW